MRLKFWPTIKRDSRYILPDERHTSALAENARRNSQRALEEARAQGAAVTEVSQSLRQLRQKNHFAELLVVSMRRT